MCGNNCHIAFYAFSCFRSTLENKDVWANMECNWVHFFWLTGETPKTLMSMVKNIDQQYFHQFQMIEAGKTDLKNQVR